MKTDKNSTVGQLANLTMNVYTFPVEVIVHLPNGTVVSHHNLNQLLFGDHDQSENNEDTITGGHDSRITFRYITALQDAVKQFKHLLS